MRDVSVLEILRHPFDTSGFPPRWHCGAWSAELGWLHIASDVAIWLAYMAIPAVLLYYTARRPHVPFRGVLFLFATFVLACGTVHLIEATIFWWPAYRFSGLLKFATAIVSWATMLALIPTVPYALGLRTPQEFERELVERRAMERALRESEAQYRELFENANDIVYLHDLQGRFTAANKAAIQATGYSRLELLGMTVDELVAPEYRALAREMTAKKLLGQAGSSYELTICTKDGHRRLFDVHSRLVTRDGAPVGVQGIARDVTEREEAAKSLRESEARFRGLLESAPDAMIIIDQHGLIKIVNSQVERMFGYGRDDLLGQPVEKLLDESLHGAYATYRDQFAADPRARPMGSGVEVHARRRDGSQLPVEISLSPFLTDDGLVVTAAVRDVTEQHEARELLAQQAEDYARSNAELEQFAYVASHDLQEPLRMVASYCQLLQRRYKGKLDADADDFINFAVDGARRMQVLINDLLTYSRAGRRDLALAETDCEQVLSDVMSNLQTAIEEREAVITHDPLPTVMADRGQLTQVLQNLVANAIKFSKCRPKVHIASERIDDEWRIAVRDHGIGIAPEYAERIFEIFKRLHGWGEYPGTGIGLAVCKKLVERHGGRIWVESTPEQGSTFFFTLPAC
ncbi:MAG TPA: PAS domain S-box protein [Pirellulales bacterium]|nr:PAS domain S-box protein [Pirellulales bacterium]